MLIEKYEEQYKPLIKRLNTVIVNNARDKPLKGTSIIIKLGIFSKKERKLIDEKITEFLIERKLTRESFQECIYLNSTTYRMNDKNINTFPILELIFYVSENIDMRTASVISKYIYENYDSNTRQFSLEDNIILLSQVKQLGTKWKLINEILKKQHRCLETRYYKLISKKKYNILTISNEINKLKNQNKRIRVSEIAKNLKTTIMNISSYYIKFLKINFMENWNEIYETFLLLFIIKYNYFTPFKVDIESLYYTFLNNISYNDIIEKISSELYLRDELINNLINEKFINKIEGYSLRNIDIDDIFFSNIISDWNKFMSSQNVLKTFLNQKLKLLIIKYNIISYNDAFNTFKKCIKLLIENNLLNKLIESSSEISNKIS